MPPSLYLLPSLLPCFLLSRQSQTAARTAAIPVRSALGHRPRTDPLLIPLCLVSAFCRGRLGQGRKDGGYIRDSSPPAAGSSRRVALYLQNEPFLARGGDAILLLLLLLRSLLPPSALNSFGRAAHSAEEENLGEPSSERGALPLPLPPFFPSAS